jgi:hypothetical protein
MMDNNVEKLVKMEKAESIPKKNSARYDEG